MLTVPALDVFTSQTAHVPCRTCSGNRDPTLDVVAADGSGCSAYFTSSSVALPRPETRSAVDLTGELRADLCCTRTGMCAENYDVSMDVNCDLTNQDWVEDPEMVAGTDAATCCRDYPPGGGPGGPGGPGGGGGPAGRRRVQSASPGGATHIQRRMQAGSDGGSGGASGGGAASPTTCTEEFDCEVHANILDWDPESITCAQDPCTETECCTVKM